MQTRSKILTVLLAALLAIVAIDAAAASHKNRRHVSTARSQPVATRSHATGDLGIQKDQDGTPIIMQGYHPRKLTPEDLAPAQRSERPVRIPRGSSTYIPPPVPSPNSPNSPPARSLTQPVVQPYNPPPITTFSDKVTGAIHAYPLEKGLGNNPLDQQQFIRQRVNQP